jgi:hypothetical protein
MVGAGVGFPLESVSEVEVQHFNDEREKVRKGMTHTDTHTHTHTHAQAAVAADVFLDHALVLRVLMGVFSLLGAGE